MILRALPWLLVVACSSTKLPPPIDHATDASAEASSGPVASGCIDRVGADGVGNDGSTTCFDTFDCDAGQYRVDCACPQATCTCSAPNGGTYRTVSFDCDAGCGYPLPGAGTACGLNP